MSAGFTYFSPPPAAACEDMDSPQYVPFDNTPPLVQLESSEGCRKVETENFFCFINREMKKLQKKVEEMPPGYYHVDYNYITSLFSNSNTFKESFLFPDSSATNIAKLHTASKSRAISVASPFSNFTKKIPSESFSRSSITRQPCSLLQWSTKASETDEAPLPAVMTHHKHFLMDDLPVEQGADVIADGDAGFCQKPLSYSEALKEVAHVTPQQDYDKSSPPVTPLLPSSYYQSKRLAVASAGGTTSPQQCTPATTCTTQTRAGSSPAPCCYDMSARCAERREYKPTPAPTAQSRGN
ncbi:uncharacterized protein LOC134533070 isoform X2 [Bacillus rossius redtenbacheri]|uniref:uncharacterized protein LOC134533070 isoform X2 n=1 Tax=Bacillus rossius redtenbacheri TaxID=93214 RepID=UPI002FDDF683